MKIPPEVMTRLIAGWMAEEVARLRLLATGLRGESLDVYADEADAIADGYQAWHLMPMELTTDEGDDAVVAELERRRHALTEAIYP